ncbi:hypothetical protein FGIG_03584 [Fasciola gigantica]|uniref:Uncharacterized protein n=1 Tax=Fasciola gigantica TaxID=46835 RepID=A0A504Y5L1_FASGI|nr:hypothetical protein FGIG_03584 [Fasciola gigantica]
MCGYGLLSRLCGASGKRRPQDRIQCTHNPGAYMVTHVCFFIRSQGHVHRANEWCDTSPSIDPNCPTCSLLSNTPRTLHVRVDQLTRCNRQQSVHPLHHVLSCRIGAKCIRTNQRYVSLAG